jgi:hypothetical protein
MEPNHNLQINILPFPHPIKEQEFAFYTEQQDSFSPIHKNELKGLIEDFIEKEELSKIDWLYSDFKPARNGAMVINIDLENSMFFANNYYRHLIRTYFKGVADIIRLNFTSEIEVWFKALQQPDPKYTIYNQFTLKVQQQRVTNGPELVVSYDGTTKVLNRSLKDLINFPTENLNWMNCNGELHRYKYMPPQFKQDSDKLFPVISNKLKPHFGVLFEKATFANRYPKYKKILESFYNDYLNKDAFRGIIPISDEGFLKVEAGNILKISDDSAQLQFGKQLGTEPKFDLANYGPYKTIDENNVHFFFIYHTPDKDLAVKKLYNYFLHGFPVKRGDVYEYIFPNMADFIKQPFHIEASGNIGFDSIETAVETVDEAIRNAKRSENIRYLAIFVSPISKLEKDPEKLKIYYRIKETLLKHGISSQVVYKENIYNKSFNYYLPNIETAILAKLGGIPWRLNRTVSSELIVGIGAFYSSTRKSRFLGSAFCFNNEGIFENFDCFLSNDTDTLAGSIRKAIMKFLIDHEKADRLIIHFYKDISKKEMAPIVDILNKLNLDIPVIIVTINKTESKGLLAFDLDSQDKFMPLSGTIVKVGRFEYLLYNNTRYTAQSSLKDKEYHFPIKISFSSSKPLLLDNPQLIQELTDQVYQFCRMYWKSVSQQSLPVTICYPEMVAEIFPHFKSETMPPYGRSNLWFL